MRYAFAVALAASLLAAAGCEEKRPLTVAEFMENEILLYGTLARCDSDPGSVMGAECQNARQAAERIAAIEERLLRKAREEAFESARAEYRARLDRERELRLKAEAAAEDARLRALIVSEPQAPEQPLEQPPE
ncbi:EexN family lipoprotein [Thioalkalivibrio sp. XN279]|uniref:EexN family lipoprotein n=1 Tax=Thioalkalivibrio sp. XN279 TaxID=2714953 RepID=UPI00140BC449|nr:EexN family lipoprotein [Thioalkalivibrio sp. XN279]NHA14961.1 EexN family lipoprotein [Thioalkalivibrio sp. XN279]